jgi:hypothetical protein
MGFHHIELKRRSVGPAHDPYLREILSVQDPAGNRAEWEECGLNGTTLRLFIAGHVLVRALNEHDNKVLKMRLLFKRHVGLTPEEARDIWERDYNSDEAESVRAAERAAGWYANP